MRRGALRSLRLAGRTSRQLCLGWLASSVGCRHTTARRTSSRRSGLGLLRTVIFVRLLSREPQGRLSWNRCPGSPERQTRGRTVADHLRLRASWPSCVGGASIAKDGVCHGANDVARTTRLRCAARRASMPGARAPASAGARCAVATDRRRPLQSDARPAGRRGRDRCRGRHPRSWRRVGVRSEIDLRIAC